MMESKVKSKSNTDIYVDAIYSPESEVPGSTLEKIRNKYIVEYGRNSYNTGLGRMKMIQAGHVILVQGNGHMYDRIKSQFFNSSFKEFIFERSKEV